ncbi:MAG: hypothetical protein FT714_15525 [Pantoea sp. Pent]|nr:hypothetical protein [Pantoea sp. Pent]
MNGLNFELEHISPRFLTNGLFFIGRAGAGVNGLNFELEHISPRLLKVNRFSLMAKKYAVRHGLSREDNTETFQEIWYSTRLQARKCAIGVADF